MTIESTVADRAAARATGETVLRNLAGNIEREIRYLENAFARHRLQSITDYVAGQWQSIESAPEDGSYLIGWWNVHFDPAPKWACQKFTISAAVMPEIATHWMALPAAPILKVANAISVQTAHDARETKGNTMTDEDALMMEAERLAIYDGTLNQRGGKNSQYHHAVARHHTALTINGWRPDDPVMKKAKTVFHKAYDAWDNVSLETTSEKISAAARVIMEAYPENEKPSAEVVAWAKAIVGRQYLNDDAVASARYILRQAGKQHDHAYG